MPSNPSEADRFERPLLPRERIKGLVAVALAEDIGAGDITTRAMISRATRARGRIVARQEMVVCGLPLAREVFKALDASLVWIERAQEGDALEAGGTIATIEGLAAPILTGERTALNFMQHLSGIATLARRSVAEVEGTRAVVLDTRKTTPTLRDIEKYAVRVGGARNHRMGLFDAVLVKDNHLALSCGIAAAVGRAAGAGFAPGSIVVEVDGLDQVTEAIEAGVGRILLDNFTPEQVARAVRLIDGRAEVEVSGGLAPGQLRAYAEAGASFLSIGRLTHSAPAADIALEVEALP